MKMLLDENLPLRLRHDYSEFEVYTVQYMGWRGKENGELLSLILEQGFEIFLTYDKNIAFQQNFDKYSIPVCVFNTSLNKYEHLSALTSQVKELIATDNLKIGINIIE